MKKITVAITIAGLILAAADPGLAKSMLKKAKNWDYFKGAQVQTYGDEPAGFEGSWDMDGSQGVFSFTGGGSWGCGVAVTREDDPVNVSGATKIVLKLKASEGLRFHFYISEDGIGPRDASSFKGKYGADGEQYYAEMMVGDESEREYTVELEDLEIAEVWGNQNGNGKLALKAISGMGFYIPPDVTDGSLRIVSISFE